MCGLSGAAGNITEPIRKSVLDHLIFNIPRGWDSSGLAFLPRYTDDVHILKQVGPATELWFDKRLDQYANKTVKMILGHNRSKTDGMITKANAHPFHHGGIVGAHNGTLDYHSKNLLKPEGPTLGTDSETLIYALSAGDAKEAFEKITGAWAVVWYDHNAGTINMTRNDQRPLCYVFSKDHKTLFWGSELNLLYGSLARNNIDHDKGFFLNPDWILSWKIPQHPDQVFEEAVKVKLIPFVKPVSTTTYHGTTTSYSSSSDSPGTRLGPIQTSTRVASVTVTEKGVSAPRQPTHNFGKLCTDGEFKGVMLYMDTASLKVGFDNKTKTWVTGRWITNSQEWQKTVTHFQPGFLPYSSLDINARHEFRHIGKKKKKQIYYVGFENKLLTESEFNSFARLGCIGCDGKPTWGNLVQFINNQHDFMCEYCILNKDLVHTTKSKGVAAL